MPPINVFAQRAAEDKAERQQQGLWRERQCINMLDGRRLQYNGQIYLQFASNDYLGLAHSIDPLATELLAQQTLGYGSGASPLVTGYHSVQAQLEQTLCALTGYEAALIFSSGFAANSAPFSLLQPGDRIFADKLSHASLIDAALASQGSLRRFAHNELTTLRSWLKSKRTPALVISESVFSMDGDRAPMAQLTELCQQYGALSWLDDAHGFGVIGPNGLGASEFAKPDLLTLTFGKALGAQGAALLGPKWLLDSMMQKARHYIYSTALSAVQCQLVLSQLTRMQRPELRHKLWKNIDYFRQLAQQWVLPITNINSPIIPIQTGCNKRALQLAEYARSQGIWLTAIRPPTVPRNQARLRVVINASHEAADLRRLTEILARGLQT